MHNLIGAAVVVARRHALALRAFVVLSLAFFLLFNAGRALAQDACTPVAVVLDGVEKAGNGLAYAILEGDNRARAIRLVREEQETLDRYWSVAVLIVFADGSGLLAVGNDGLLCAGVKIHPDNMQKLLTIIAGRPA